MTPLPTEPTTYHYSCKFPQGIKVSTLAKDVVEDPPSAVKSRCEGYLQKAFVTKNQILQQELVLAYRGKEPWRNLQVYRLLIIPEIEGATFATVTKPVLPRANCSADERAIINQVMGNAPAKEKRKN